jgi:hypothetical protein
VEFCAYRCAPYELFDGYDEVHPSAVRGGDLFHVECDLTEELAVHKTSVMVVYDLFADENELMDVLVDGEDHSEYMDDDGGHGGEQKRRERASGGAPASAVGSSVSSSSSSASSARRAPRVHSPRKRSVKGKGGGGGLFSSWFGGSG